MIQRIGRIIAYAMTIICLGTACKNDDHSAAENRHPEVRFTVRSNFVEPSFSVNSQSGATGIPDTLFLVAALVLPVVAAYSITLIKNQHEEDPMESHGYRSHPVRNTRQRTKCRYQ